MLKKDTILSIIFNKDTIMHSMNRSKASELPSGTVKKESESALVEETDLSQIMKIIEQQNAKIGCLEADVMTQKLELSRMKQYLQCDFISRVRNSICEQREFCYCTDFRDIHVGQTLQTLLVTLARKYTINQEFFFTELSYMMDLINSLRPEDICNEIYRGPGLHKLRVIVFLYLVTWNDFTGDALSFVKIYEACFPDTKVNDYDLQWFPLHVQEALGNKFEKALKELSGQANQTSHGLFSDSQSEPKKEEPEQKRPRR